MSKQSVWFLVGKVLKSGSMKKFFLLGIGLTTLFLTGCERREVVDADPESPQGNQSVVLEVWTTEQAKFFESLGREFASVLGAPSLRFKVVNFDDPKVLQEVLVDKLAEGAGPDIIFTSGEWIAQNPAKLVTAETSDGFTAENFRNTFVQGASETLILNDLDILGVPLTVDSLALLFNDEHITDRLIDRNYPGRTWEELREDATVLSKKDNSFERFNVSGVALGRADNLNYGPEILENLMLQAGVQFFDETGTLATFDDTQTVLPGGRKVNAGLEMLNYFTSFADERYKNHSWNAYLADSEGNDKDLRTFAQGKTSMTFAYARDLPRLQRIISDLKASGESPIADNNIRVAFLPQTEDPQLSPNRRVVGHVQALAVTRNTAYPDTAWSFLKFAIEKDNLQKWYEETLLPSPRLDLLVEQEQLPLIGVYVRQAKFARANLMPLPKIVFYEALKSGINAVNSGRMSSSKALETSALAVNQILQRQIARLKALTR